MRSENLVPGVMLLLQVWIPPSAHPDLHYNSHVGGGGGEQFSACSMLLWGPFCVLRTPEALVPRRVQKGLRKGAAFVLRPSAIGCGYGKAGGCVYVCVCACVCLGIGTMSLQGSYNFLPEPGSEEKPQCF